MRGYRFLALLLCAVASAPFGLPAQTTCLRISDIHGNTSYFMADEALCLEKSGENIIIISSGSEIMMKADQVKGFGYEKRELSDIQDIEPGVSYVRIEADRICISAPEEWKGHCSVYGLNGVLIDAFDYSEETVISLRDYTKGIYVVRIGNAPALKFVVR